MGLAEIATAYVAVLACQTVVAAWIYRWAIDTDTPPPARQVLPVTLTLIVAIPVCGLMSSIT